MRNLFLFHKTENRLVTHGAETHNRARGGGDGPGETPPVAMEHRQGPQVNRLRSHFPGGDIGQRVQMSAAIVIHDPLGITRRPGSVVQADCIPFIVRGRPHEIAVTLGKKLVIGNGPDATATLERFVQNVDNQNIIPTGHLDGPAGDFGKLRVNYKHLGFGVVQYEGYRFGIQPGIDSIQNRTSHGHGEVRFIDFRDVGCDDGNRIALAVAPLGQSAGKLSTAIIGFRPAAPDLVIDHRCPVRIDMRGPRHKADGGKRCIVCRGLIQPHFIDFFAHRSVPPRNVTGLKTTVQFRSGFPVSSMC